VKTRQRAQELSQESTDKKVDSSVEQVNKKLTAAMLNNVQRGELNDAMRLKVSFVK
jgi:hypothetical protein